MYCAYHPTNAASTPCASCGRPLCAACDHRIKAQPYCEDCIVRGVDALRRPPVQVVPAQYAGYRSTPSPTKATLLALIPGLGAVYNRQNLKALVHFIGAVALFELGDRTDLGFFIVGGLVFFLFTLIDANRTARAIAAGADPSEDEQRIKWLFARYKPAWGFLLVIVGLITLLSMLPSLPFGITSTHLWAGGLLLTGGYLIFSYFRSLGDEEPPQFAMSPPRSVVSAMLPPPDSDRITASYGEGRTTAHLQDR